MSSFSSTSSPLSDQLVPKSVKLLHKLLDSLDEETTFRSLIDLGVKYIVRGERIEGRDYNRLKVASNLKDTEFDLLFNGLLTLLRISLRRQESSLVKREEDLENYYRQELVSQLRLNPKHAEILGAALFSANRKFGDGLSLSERRPRLASVYSIRWRVDVNISSKCLSRIMEPIVVIELELDNILIGDIDGNNKERRKPRVVFETNSASFHRLRFSVANALKELQQIEEQKAIK